MDLVRSLSDSRLQRRLGDLRGQLPARLDKHSDLTVRGNRFTRELSCSELRGRTLPHQSLWAVVKERPTRTLAVHGGSYSIARRIVGLPWISSMGSDKGDAQLLSLHDQYDHSVDQLSIVGGLLIVLSSHMSGGAIEHSC